VDLLARWQIDHGSGGYPASLKPARHPPEWWPAMDRNGGPSWSGTVARHQPEYATWIAAAVIVIPQLLMPVIVPSQEFRDFCHYLGTLVYYR
jgi:hypothetical protein